MTPMKPKAQKRSGVREEFLPPSAENSDVIEAFNEDAGRVSYGDESGAFSPDYLRMIM